MTTQSITQTLSQTVNQIDFTPWNQSVYKHELYWRHAILLFQSIHIIRFIKLEYTEK